MFTRMLILMLMVTLALPVATLTRPGESHQTPWTDSAVAAKGSKSKKNAKQKNQKQKNTTATRTLRGPITQTFLNSETITVPNGAPGTTQGPAGPYPTTIEVSGLPNGVITDVDLLLLDVTHKVPEDIDILLSSSDGRHVMPISDVGRIISVTNVDLTLDDEAASSLPQSELTSGAFRPTDINSAGQPADTFAAPAPAPDGSVALSTFDGANPNGTWRLFVTDNANGDVGDLGGWALRITAEVDLATVDEQVPTGKDTKKGKRKHRR